MKCPKCGYLGYEKVERCRNCGYDFSLSASAAPTPTMPDLRLRDSSTPSVPQPLEDLRLVDAATPNATPDPYDLRPGGTPAAAADNAVAELPLFGPPITDDVPLITSPSKPRPPLSVRRATPEVPRLRAEPRAPLLDDWTEPAPPSKEAAARSSIARPAASTAEPLRRRAAAPVRTEAAEDGSVPAGILARGLATLVDVVLLAVVDLVVVYLTLKICRLDIAELGMLPKAPLLIFLLLQNGGYFVAFTTTGQTLGKMIAGVRVLSEDSDSAPDLGRSAIRALLWMVLALPAGLGLLSATVSRDRRGLHDRFAGTRVVRAGV
jgi:uncharacterized RDD family membrane protein YckC